MRIEFKDLETASALSVSVYTTLSLESEKGGWTLMIKEISSL